MKNRLMLGVVVILAFAGIAIDFVSAFWSILSDLIFIGGLLYLVFQLDRSRVRQIKDLEDTVRYLRETKRTMLS